MFKGNIQFDVYVDENHRSTLCNFNVVPAIGSSELPKEKLQQLSEIGEFLKHQVLTTISNDQNCKGSTESTMQCKVVEITSGSEMLEFIKKSCKENYDILHFKEENGKCKILYK